MRQGWLFLLVGLPVMVHCGWLPSLRQRLEQEIDAIDATLGGSVRTNEVQQFLQSHLTNVLVDFVLSEVRHYLIKTGQTRIAIPDIEQSFRHTYLGIEVEEDFNARRGWFENPATIKRKGDADLSRHNGTLFLKMDVKFDTMKLGFDEYSISLLDITQKGTIRAIVGDNTIQLIGAFEYKPECVFTLQEITLSPLSDLDIEITGLGVLNSIADDIVDWLIIHYQDSVRSLCNAILQSKIQETFDEINICHYIPH